MQPQDFFQHNQQSGPNIVYTLRAILHDWSDELATQILRSIGSVMHETSRSKLSSRGTNGEQTLIMFQSSLSRTSSSRAAGSTLDNP